MIQADSTSSELITYCIRSTAKFLRDPVGRPFVFATSLDNYPFLKCEMFALIMPSCGRIIVIHSDPPV